MVLSPWVQETKLDRPVAFTLCQVGDGRRNKSTNDPVGSESIYKLDYE